MNRTHCIFALSLLALAGCRKSPVFAASYLGAVTEQAHVELDPSAAVPQSWDTNRPRGNVRVAVTPAGDRHFRVALPGCTVEIASDPEPNEHNAPLLLSPPQVCPVDVDHFRGSLAVTGNAVVDRANNTLRVTLTGANPQGSPFVRWTLTYDARPE